MAASCAETSAFGRECAVRLRRTADAGMGKGLRMRYRSKDDVLAVLQIL
jgi:hypothetical protein